MLGRVLADLEFLQPEQLLDNLPERLHRVERGMSDLSETVARSYFATVGRGRLEPSRSPQVSWRIAVRHRTGYQYETPARASYNEVRMTPATAGGQHTLQSKVDTSPAAGTFRYVDYWGTVVHAFDVHEPHNELVVTATSVVETSGAHGGSPVFGWADFEAGGQCDRYAELLVPSRYVLAESELDEVGAELAAQYAPVEAGRRAVAWVNEQLDYVRGVTQVSTTSAEARARGEGVCQDFAHVALALLRAARLPARYVSGYLYPGKEPAVLDEPVLAESHAWVEFWAGDWVAADPSNLSEVADRHVTRCTRTRLRRRSAADGHLLRSGTRLARRHRRAHPPSLTGGDGVWGPSPHGDRRRRPRLPSSDRG